MDLTVPKIRELSAGIDPGFAGEASFKKIVL
jgi:hypothetical protein